MGGGVGDQKIFTEKALPNCHHRKSNKTPGEIEKHKEKNHSPNQTKIKPKATGNTILTPAMIKKNYIDFNKL